MLKRQRANRKRETNTWVQPLVSLPHHEAHFWLTCPGIPQPSSEALQYAPEAAHQLPWWLPARVLLTSQIGTNHIADCNPAAVPGINKERKARMMVSGRANIFDHISKIAKRQWQINANVRWQWKESPKGKRQKQYTREWNWKKYKVRVKWVHRKVRLSREVWEV